MFELSKKISYCKILFTVELFDKIILIGQSFVYLNIEIIAWKAKYRDLREEDKTFTY